MSPTDTPVSPPAAPRGLRSAAIVAALVLLAIVAIGLTTRARSSAELQAWTEENAVPTVAVLQPQPLGTATGLQLPGRLEAYAQAPLYARASGYLKRWTVDIGLAVKAGQVLAELETPELDQQLAQARADLARAEADAELARITARRWQSMRGTDAVSQQEIDEKTGDAAAKAAAVRSAQANLERLMAMQGFQRVLAPFAGIITARNTDVGALIVAGEGEPLFTIADTRRLRLYVQVPQVYMPSIEIGQAATVTVPEHPGRVFAARIDRSAHAVSASSGGTLVEMVVDNAEGALLPGGYADVSIELPGRAEGAAVPASVLIFDADGTQVAAVGEGDQVVMKPVTILRDLGKVVEISGVAPDDRLIDSPPDSLRAGDVVRVAANRPAAPAT